MNIATIGLISKVLDMILMGVQMIPAVKAEMEELKGKLSEMVAEGRDPTPEEWDALNLSIEDKLARLRAASNQ